MIGRERRDLYAEHLRHFAAGRTTDDEYITLTEDLFYDTPDYSVVAIYYSISLPHAVFRMKKIQGKLRLTEKARKTVARCVLFLHSDREYELPKMSAQGRLLDILTLGCWRDQLETRLINESDCWPFLCHEDLETAKRTPKFFARQAA